MHTKLAASLVALAFLFATPSASAMPKAAEDIDSPVTTGSEVARPRAAVKKPTPSLKASKAVKSSKTAPRRKSTRVKA